MQDHRSVQRFAFWLPAWLDPEHPDPDALIRDISANGAFLYTESSLAVNSQVEFVTKIPLGNAAYPEMRVKYEGRVVRSEALTLGKFGVAVRIDRYQCLS